MVLGKNVQLSLKSIDLHKAGMRLLGFPQVKDDYHFIGNSHIRFKTTE